MNHSDIIQQRLHNQRLTRPDFETPAEVVRWFGAVQAQDLFASLYAIGLRMRDATETLVERAVADKTVVRTWPMRGTIHFVPPEDAAWMLRLLARRINVKYQGLYRKAGLNDETIRRAGEVFTRAMQGHRQLTRKELYAALAEGGIAAPDGPANLHLLGYWAQEGLICFGPRRGKQPTFTLLNEWVPPGRQLEGEDALAELARRYFTSHGPAAVHDFAWWSGLTIAEARRGVDAAGPALVPETVDGRTYLSRQPVAPPPVQPGPAAYLLPAYDEFTVAYKDRSAIVDPAFKKEQALFGLGYTMVLDGRIAGVWKRTLARDSVTVRLSPISPLSSDQRDAFAQAAERYGRFVGLSALIE